MRNSLPQRFAFIVAVIGLAACSTNRAVSGSLGLCAVEVPESWAVSSSDAQDVKIHAPDNNGLQIVLVDAKRLDGGSRRDPVNVAKAIADQASAFPGATAVHVQHTGIRDRAVALVAWTYTNGDAQMSRRHWIVFYPEAIVHVSCAQRSPLDETDCDRIAATAHCSANPKGDS